jgi:hypothetical protein
MSTGMIIMAMVTGMGMPTHTVIPMHTGMAMRMLITTLACTTPAAPRASASPPF